MNEGDAVTLIYGPGVWYVIRIDDGWSGRVLVGQYTDAGRLARSQWVFVSEIRQPDAPQH